MELYKYQLKIIKQLAVDCKKNPEKVKGYLRDAGIITPTGRLTKNYRGT